MKNYKPEDIVLMMTSLGYKAEHVTGISTHEKSGGKERNHIKIETGRRVDAVLHLEGGKAKFRTYGKFPEGHNGQTGEDLETFNNRQAMIVKGQLAPALVFSFMQANPGEDPAAVAEIFGLRAPKGNAPGQELDDEAPEASTTGGQRRSSIRRSNAPAQTA